MEAKTEQARVHGVQRLSRSLADLGVLWPTSHAERLHAELVQRYREPHRVYHGLAHAEACLAWLDWFTGHAERPAEAALALWFHDAVYEPRRHDNELQSAQLAVERLTAAGVAACQAGRVGELVRATGAHVAASGDGALVCGIDLAVLGAPRADYAEYARAVRREYAHVPDTAYRAGRRSFLKGLLARPEIYRQPLLARELERRARANLSWELAGC